MVAGPNVLVDPAWIAAHLDDPLVRLIEVDVSRAAYDAGHIPGAVLWNAYVDLRSPDYTPIDQTGLAAAAVPGRCHAGDDRRLLRLRPVPRLLAAEAPGPRPRARHGRRTGALGGCRRGMEH